MPWRTACADFGGWREESGFAEGQKAAIEYRWAEKIKWIGCQSWRLIWSPTGCCDRRARRSRVGAAEDIKTRAGNSQTGETRSFGAPPPRRCLVDDVIATVDVQRFTGNKAGRIVREEGGGPPTSSMLTRLLRGPCFRLVEQLIELGNAGGRARRERPGEMACTRMPLGPSSAAR